MQQAQKQTQIYEFLGICHDPIFSLINELKRGESTVVLSTKISLNSNDYYEFETRNAHEMYRTKEELYDALCRYLNDGFLLV